VAQRLIAAMDAHVELRTQAALAKRAGLAQTTIGRIRRAEVDTSADNLRRIADALGLEVGHFYDEPPRGLSQNGNSVPQFTSPSRRVPLVSWAAIEVQALDDMDSLKRNVERWLACPDSCGPHTFALKVSGGSMQPRFVDGDVIFCDPDARATSGRLVIARGGVGGEALFRELVVEGRHRYLRRLNPAWPGPEVIALDHDSEIIGVVIGKWVPV